MPQSSFSSILDALYFESSPTIAVAVSGGSDSMALVHLAHHWATKRKGKVIALTVDHQLRPASAVEADLVHVWLTEAGIEHHCLHWEGDKPGSNIQSEARTARYSLMAEWCAERHILHLLVAHHRDDQAETLLMRLERGSGIDGLSSMPFITSYKSLRIIRPLLSFSKKSLQAYLLASGKEWVEDPTNVNTHYTRNRIRQSLSLEDDLMAKRLAATATHLGRVRVSTEISTAKTLARAVNIYAEGYALLNAEDFKQAATEEGLQSLAALLKTLGGNKYKPRFQSLETLYNKIMAGGLEACTLWGCRIIPLKHTRVLFCREPASIERAGLLEPYKWQRWDDRFCVMAKAPVYIDALGEAGARNVLALDPSLNRISLPKQVIITLPTFKSLDSILAIPHISYYKEGITAQDFFCRFQPRSALTGAPFHYGNTQDRRVSIKE